ncbi:MAG: helix-turn-helix domain-containing protein [Clostridium fessum]
MGYNDSHYFSAAFKKVMGQSPKEYKASQTRQE